MRSGFLNSSPSDAPSSSSEKGSRNKRKFRTDHHPQLPIPTSACVHNGESDKNRTVCDGNACSSTTKDIYNADPAVAAAPASSRCCNYGQHTMLPNHSNYPSYQTGLPIMDCRLHSCDIHMGLRHISYSKHDKGSSDLQGSDWDQLSEAQLEEILMNMLDVVYKDAIKKIILYDFSHDDALSAVLKNGRWNGRDALASIVDNSLAWLKNKEAKAMHGDPVFSDLKQLETYVLAEMVSKLRKVRPYMSKGDAMWFLLMCDLNVFLACTTEEDAYTSSNVKDGIISNVVLPQSTASVNGNLPLPTAPPTVVGMPSPEPISGNAQTSTGLMSSHKDNRSAFSTPSFSSSPVGKVAIASRKGVSKSSSTRGMHSPISSINREVVISNQGNNTSHNISVANPYHLSLPQAPVIDKHSANFGLSFPQGNNKFEYVDKVHRWQPDNVVTSVSTSDALIQTVQSSSSQCMPQCLDIASNSGNSSVQTSLLNESCQIKGENTVYSNSQLQSTDDHSAQVEIQMGGTSTAFSTVEGVLGAGLSLRTSSPVNNLGKEVTGNIQENDCINETFLTQTEHNSSGSRLSGSNDSEERKAVMLWQLVEHVKYLEAQLQLWTDWAQQKVMQAARRLTKDSAELKALRQERDEYVRLKKEKQTLEESTMKKLAEMENALRKAVSQIDRANSTAWRLEAENAELRAEMEAAKVAAAVSISECDKASKREEMSVKKAQGWEKQKQKLQDDVLNGNRNLSNLLEQLSLAKERLQQTEARWKQEKTSKEEALLRAETEKKAKEELELSAKRRVEVLQQKCEAESQHHHDEVKKIENEIAGMRLSLGLQPSPLSWENELPHTLDTYSMDKLKQIHAKLLSEVTDLQQEEVHRDWECVMCMNEEISVVFLPCAHQIVCIKCNELHQKQGLRECPSCRTPIQRRIRVYGARS